MDTIFVRKLKVDTCIGIYDWERESKQTVLIDLDIAADVQSAAQTDKVESTINYHTICLRIVEHISISEVELVETLAEQIADIIRTEFAVVWVRVIVHKPSAVRDARDVGVMIERGKRPKDV